MGINYQAAHLCTTPQAQNLADYALWVRYLDMLGSGRRCRKGAKYFYFVGKEL